MKKNKFSLKEKIVLTVLVVLMIAAAVVGAVLIVGNTNRANERLMNTEHTTIASAFETEMETASDKDSTERKADGINEKTTSAKEDGAKTSDSEQNNNTTKTKSTVSKPTKSSGGKGNNGKPANNAAKPDKVVPATNPTHASDKVCTINGKKCYVGDTVTAAINLKTPVILENYQGYTEYDRNYLEYVSAKMTSGGIYNEKDGIIYYNASILSGIDFTSKGTIYTVSFKVKKEGSTEVKNTIKVLTDRNDKAVKLSDCKEELEIYD